MQEESYDVLKSPIIRECTMAALVRKNPASHCHRPGDRCIGKPKRQPKIKWQGGEAEKGTNGSAGERLRQISQRPPSLASVAVIWNYRSDFGLGRHVL